MAIKEEVGLIFFSRFLVFPVITVRGLLSARASLDRQHLATLWGPEFEKRSGPIRVRSAVWRCHLSLGWN